jgi:uncharacterized protein
MQKVVIDTNVIVSSIIQKGYSYRIIHDLFLEDKFQFCVSSQLLAEYYEVLARPRFSKFPDFFTKAESILVDIESRATKYEPKIKLDLISDKDDNMVLELADASMADFLITGNSTDFTFATYKETKIVSPREYWENHYPNI